MMGEARAPSVPCLPGAEYGDEGTEAMTSRSAFGTMLFTVKVLDLTLPTFQTRYQFDRETLSACFALEGPLGHP